MAAAPPPYDAVVGPYTEACSDLWVQTFWPICLGTGEKAKHCAFERFMDITKRANHWLLNHPQVVAYTCETVEKKIYRAAECSLDHSLTCLGDGSAVRIKGLRLWLRPNPSGKPQSIFYIDCVPTLRTLAPSRIQNEDDSRRIVYESISQIVSRFNEQQKRASIEGKIISINTVCQCTAKQDFDPHRVDSHRCSTYDTYKYHRFSFIRIFAEAGPRVEEIIGLADFLPMVKTIDTRWAMGKCKPEYSDFASVASQADAWLRRNGNIKVTNCQTLNTRYWRAPGSDELQHYTLDTYEYKSEDKLRVRFLRVAYTQKITSDPAFEMPAIQSFKHHNFYPSWIPGGSKFDMQNFCKTVEFAHFWLNAADARVLCMETDYMSGRLKDICRDVADGFDAMCNDGEWYIINDGEGGSSYHRYQSIQFCRAYIIGPFREPRPEELPRVTMPQVERGDCEIL